MPLYEYQCGKCQHRFEKIQKFSDPGPEVCPVCGEAPVVRLPSSPAIQFKGTGWYITDYAKKSGTDGSKSDTGEKSASGTSETAAKSDSGSTASSETAATPAPATTTKETKSS
jgi:putative FmdB family regulatory protein